MNETERELDLMVAELGSEIRMLVAQNETLKRNLNAVTAERDGFKEALERILAISRVAFRNGQPQGVSEVGAKAQARECND